MVRIAELRQGMPIARENWPYALGIGADGGSLAGGHPASLLSSSTPTVLRRSTQRLGVRELPWVTSRRNPSTLKGLRRFVGVTVTFDFAATLSGLGEF
jgi:hypothetical protein